MLLGSAAWWLVLTTAVGAMRMRVTPRWIGRINVASGVVIGVFAIVVIASALVPRSTAGGAGQGADRLAASRAARHAAARIRLSAPARPASHASPCPGSTHFASIASSFARDARASSGFSVNGAGRGPVSPVRTLLVVMVSPMNTASTAGTWIAELPGVCPGRWMTRGAPGRSRVAPSSNVTTSVSGGDPQTSAPAAVREEAKEGPDLHGTPTRGWFLDLTAGAIRVQCVDVDGDASLATQPLGKADVVGVAVSEDHAADVFERPAHGGELGRQVAPIAGQAGVDDRHRAAVLDEVAVHEAGAQPVQGWGDLHVDPLFQLPREADRSDSGRSSPKRMSIA